MITKRIYNGNRWILGLRPYSNNELDNYLDIVLAYLPTNKITPYVTWVYNQKDKGFIWGHYFEFIHQTIEHFLERGPIGMNDEYFNKFDAIETHYVTYLIEEGCWEQCDSDDAQMISVYGHKEKGGLECISDHFDGKDAMRIVRWLSNKYELPIRYQPKDVHYAKLKPIIK